MSFKEFVHFIYIFQFVGIILFLIFSFDSFNFCKSLVMWSLFYFRNICLLLFYLAYLEVCHFVDIFKESMILLIFSTTFLVFYFTDFLSHIYSFNLACYGIPLPSLLPHSTSHFSRGSLDFDLRHFLFSDIGIYSCVFI